ncbi:hypothetical protein PV728_48170 [Streptomyces europaeiscabiei]|uniref:hypothetical protein n=1 Tax=Streptomyces europaeiscabiei TaxID=146819 RepID=UPI0029A0157F|nr:hypothetical protein [Streptomyces europaeiscabiei]MDX3637826.1 hypothetical protein [Streptomyces europaeiscabiei]MDX3655643.1 hypothetical protein [Streptomyces europaeiscabiei]
MKRIDQPTQQPTPGDVYTSAASRIHDAHCPPCRDVTTTLAATDAALAVSTARSDRYTLGLRNTHPTAVTA